MSHPPLIAGDILALLAKRHAGDLFVPECKDGPTQGTRTRDASHFRLDAWAMARSWANPRFYGYEIKVTRADFLRDEKLHCYLPLCSDAYLVCPRGLISDDETPAGYGLLWVASTGNRLVTKRKAPHREVTPPADLLLYILMCRAEIKPEWGMAVPERRADFFRRWLETREVNRDLGRRVSKALSERIEEELVKARGRAAAAETTAAALSEIGALLARLGIAPAEVEWRGVRRVREAIGELPDGLLRDITTARASLQCVEERLKQSVALAGDAP